MRSSSSARSDATRALFALIAGAVCIGFAAIWVRWSEVGPIATAFHRLLLALPILAIWAFAERKRGDHPSRVQESGTSRTLAAWTIAAGVLFAVDLAAWHLSIRLTTVANATLLGNFAPIFVTLGAWLFLREPVGSRFVTGMALAFVGAWLLTGARFDGPSGRLRGDLLALVTAVFYGGYQLSVARLRRELPPGRILLWSSVVCTPVLGLMALAAGETIRPGTVRGWGVLVGLSLTAQILGQGLITYGFAHLPAGYSSLTLLVQPVVAAAAGWCLFGEALTVPRALGGGIVLAGLLLARRRV